MRAGRLYAGLSAALFLWSAGRADAGGISGQITDASSGTPLAGIGVRIESVSAGFIESVTSDAFGVWQSTANLASGNYRVRTTNSLGYFNERYNNVPCVGSCSTAGESQVTVVDPNITAGINFALAQGGSISGTTLDDSTGLAADTFINVYNSAGTFVTQTRTLSGGTGAYRTEGLPPGTYFLLTTSLANYVSELYNNSPCVQGCSVTSGAPVTIAGTASVTGIDFSLTKGGYISGNLTSASSGAALSGVSVKIHDASGALVTTASGIGFWILPANGGAVKPGTYYAVTSNTLGYGDERYDDQACASPSCDPLLGTPIVVTAGSTKSGINFALNQASQIAINAGDRQSATAGTAVAVPPSVIVRNSTNDPVAGVPVTFAAGPGGGSVTGATQVTNASGIATVGGWTLGTNTGPNTLTATSPGLAGSVLTFAASGVAGPATQMEGTQVWTTSGPLGTALVNVIAVDPVTPATIYVGTENAGVFKSTNAGASWSPASRGGLADTRVFSIAIDPLTPSTLYAGTDQGVFKSTDAAGIWTPASTGLTSTTMRAVVIDPTTPSTLYSMTSSTGGLFKSTDAGATWNASNTGISTQIVRALAIDPTDSSTLYAATSGGGMFKSVNAGNAWVATNAGVTAGVISNITIDQANPSTIYAGGTSRLLKSTNAGASWIVVQSFTVNQVVVDPSTPSIVYSAGLAGIYKSTDSGATWVEADSGLNSFFVSALAASPSTPSTLYAGTYGGSGLFKTTNSASSWTATTLELDAPVVSGLAIHHQTPSTVYAGAYTGAFTSTNSGDLWTRLSGLNTSQQVKTVAIHPATPSTLYAGLINIGGAVFTSLFKSINSGVTWAAANTGTATTGVSAVVIHPTSPSTVFVGATSMGVFRSIDDAASWVTTNTGLTNLNVNTLVIDAVSPSTLYAGTNGGVFKSTNSASNWTAANSGLTNLTVRALAIHPSTTSTLYAGTLNGLFKSLDSGGTWTAANTGLTSTAVNAVVIHPTNPSTLYAGTDSGGVFISSDSGATWQAINSGLEITKVRTLLLDPSGANLYAGLHTVWTMPTAAPGASQTAPVGTAVATRPSVIVRDANGNPVSGVSVTFAAVSGGGSVTGETQTTNALGIATVGNWVVGPTPGTDNNTLSASTNAFAGSPVVFTASGSGATQIAINAGNNQSAPAGSAVAIPPTVIVKDASNNPVAGVSVTFQVGSGGGNLPFAAASIATGYAHSCALTTAGGVKCWGSNTYGQLGDGTTTRRLSAVDVQGLSSGVASVSIGGGGNHTCAVTTGGAAKCWGRNTNGQIGDGTSVDRTTPTDVTGLSTGVLRMAAANFHTCALTTGGGVKCWGAGSSGALGDGTTNSRTSPIAVSGLSSGVVSVAAGLGTSCAVTTGGAAKCWGNNGNGQLGDGTTLSRSTPVDVSGLTTGVASVAAGDFYTCALTSAGGVKCWGANSAGRLGHGDGPDVSLPTDVTGLTAGVSRIATGVAHTCAVTTAGGAKCWGIGGALGDGTSTSRATPVDALGLTEVAGVSASWVHSCAVTGAGRVKCFGGNSEGHLGDGTTTSRLIAVNVAGLSNVTRITDGSGIASVEWMLGPTAGAGNNSLTAMSSNLTGSPVTFTASATASIATQLILNSGNSQTATVGTAVATAPSVRVLDTYGNAISGMGVTFAVATGGGSVTGAVQTTNASGVATVGSWTLGTTAGVGNNVLTATVPGLAGSPLTITASATAGIATQIGMNAGNNQTATAGSAVGTLPSVIVRDANNNPKSGVSVTFGATAGGGSVTGGTQTTNAAGIATVGSWTLGVVAGAENRLTVTATGLSGSPVTFVASSVAGSATQLVVSAGPDTSTVAGTEVARIPAVIARDAHNNPVAGVAVTFTPTGGGSVVDGDAVTGVTGNARVTSWTVGTTPGTNNNSLVAAAPGLSGSPITFTISVAPPPTQMAIYAGDGQVAGVTQPVALPAAVIVKDVNGNPVSGTVVAFDVSAGGGTLPSGVTQIMGGGWHSCALMGGGDVKCWGSKVGDGQNLRARLIPVDVTGLDGVTSLSTSSVSDSTCVVTAGGGAKCWGANSGGLGDGVSSLSSVPRDVQNVSGVQSIATGLFHICAITTGGAVKCWGENSAGQVGDSTTTSRTTAVDVSGLASGAKSLAVGTRHSCVVTTGGGAKCWGDNTSGQLGDGTTTNRKTPVDVSGLTSGVLSLAAGDLHTCALLASGGVKCWGSNSEGRLGDGTSVDRSTPVSVVGLATGVGSVAVGYWHSCAMLSGGGVKCWGRNTESQLGDGTRTNRATPAEVLGLSAGIAQLSSGGFHTCVLIQPASVKCWGYNASGRLGDGTSVERSAPVNVVMLGLGIHTTDGAGIARLRGWTLGPTAGTSNNAVTAISGTLAGSPLTFTASATAGPPTQIAINTGNNQTATVDTAVATAPSVIVRDANNNPVSGVSITFAVATGGGTLTGATPTTNAEGVATLGSWTLGPTVGANTLTATVAGLAGSLTFTATAVSSPTVASPSSSDVGSTVATLGANVQTDGGSAITSRGVVYALTAANPNPVLGGSGVTSMPVSGTTGLITGSLTGLVPGTSYSFKGFATNAVGTGYSSASTFTTLALPTTTTGAASDVTLSSATLAGLVNPRGNPTAARFDYGVTLAYGSQVSPAPPGSDTSDVPVTAVVSGLSCGTTYHFRLVATSSAGTTNGSDATFTTADCQGLSINDPSIAEGGAGTSILAFTITLPQASPSDVSVAYATAAGSATAGTDFTAATGTFTIPAGTTSKNLTVLVTGDIADEPDESFTLVLSDAVGATIAKSVGTGTIVNDDPPAAATLVTQYRLYHDGTKEHLYTTDFNEYNVLGSRGWVQEGIAYKMLTNGVYNGVMATIPFFRVYHSGILQHHWTSDSNEARVLSAIPVWAYEGTIGYLLPTQAPGTVPLYRMALASPPIHLWTTDKNEYDTLATFGWTPEGIVGYVIP
jgi:alpha-tubulin suppressor-like RCC1 family protein/ligand-binding sensor domain-containing protein